MSIRLKLSSRTKLLIVAGIIVVGTSSVAAFNMLNTTSADEMNTTEVKVQEHEQRLDKNEKDIADTKQQAAEAEQKADDAKQTAAAAQDRVTIVEKRVEVQSSAPQVQVATPPTPSPEPVVIIGHCYGGGDPLVEVPCTRPSEN